MKKILLLLITIFITSGIYAQKTKKITVVDYIIEKYSVPSQNMKTYERSTRIHTNRDEFHYLNNGILEKVKRYTVDDGGIFLTVIEMSSKNKIKQIEYSNFGEVKEFKYKANELYQIETTGALYKKPTLHTYSYNNKNAPSHVSIDNEREIDFLYDENGNLTEKKSNTYSEKYVYDNKIQVCSHLPFYYSISHRLSPAQELLFTNYNPKNNLTERHTPYMVDYINYTYNADGLPITAIITTTEKDDGAQPSITAEYEFYYKEITISTN